MDSTDVLCKVCRDYPLEYFYEDPCESKESLLPDGSAIFRPKPDLKLRWDWTEIVENFNCPICRFLRDVVVNCEDVEPDERSYVRIKQISDKRTMIAREDGSYAQETQTPYPLSVIIGEKVVESDDEADLFDGAKSQRPYESREQFVGLFLPLEQDHVNGEARSSAGCARSVDPEVFSIDLIKSWLKRCEQHGGACNDPLPENSLEIKIRVIDVGLKMICDLPEKEDYYALSYCWGGIPQRTLTKINLQDWNKPGGLGVEDDMAPTIWDAMECKASIKLTPTMADLSVTYRLGGKYLWVDSMCIIQDEDSDRSRHIESMHLIYHNAYATLINSSGTTCNSGFVGLSSKYPRSLLQAQMRLGSHSWATVDDIWWTSLRTCPWNERAWTLQERICSRRNIIFQDNKVLFHCARAKWDEDMYLEDVTPTLRDTSHELVPLSLLLQALGESESPVDREKDIWEYLTTLQHEYLRRKMSDDMDILNAFNGITGMLTAYGMGNFLFGLPEKAFHRHIGWTARTGPSTRRPGFPSWSWAGWSDNLDDGSHASFLFLGGDPIVQFHAFHGEKLRAVGGGTRSDQAKELHPHFAPQDGLESDIVPEVLETQLPLYTELSHVLVFLTSSATLKLRDYKGSHYQDTTKGQYEVIDPKSGRRLEALISEGMLEQVSNKTYREPALGLWRSWVKEHSREHEFVVIACGETYAKTPNPWVKLMLIQRAKGGTVSSRVQCTSIIAAKDWWGVNPEMKLIILG
jgi:hypothetical protein